MKESVALTARVGSQLWGELGTREEPDVELDDDEEEEDEDEKEIYSDSDAVYSVGESEHSLKEPNEVNRSTKRTDS